MEYELLFTTIPTLNPKGFNQQVKILAIQEKTFQYRYFESMSECHKSIGASVREISRISADKLYTCSKGWTFIRANERINIKEEIRQFQQARQKLDISRVPTSRKCSKCGIEKPLNAIYFHRGRTSSKYGKLRFKEICKECRKGEHKNDYKNRKDKIANNDRLRALNIFNIYKKIDKNKGRYFDLTVDWINDNIINKECIYCGSTDNMGIDRILNNIGHIKSNCIPCCKVCNITRMDNFSHEEFKLIGSVIKVINRNRIENGITTK